MKSSNCDKCKYKFSDKESKITHGWCYMFRTKERGACSQYKNKQLEEKGDK